MASMPWAPHSDCLSAYRTIQHVPSCDPESDDWLRFIGQIAGWKADEIDLMRSHRLIETVQGESSKVANGALLQIACGDRDRNRSTVWTMRHADKEGIVDCVVWVAHMKNPLKSGLHIGAYQVVEWVRYR